jgi:DNA-binding IclR family transcriptional regulator
MEHAVTFAHDSAHPRASRVQSVDRAVILMRAVAAASGRDATVAALARACELNRATAWRILSTLEAHGMVCCDRDTGQWSVGLTVTELARSVGLGSLVAVAHPVLQELSGATGETADLAVLRGAGLTYVDEVRPAAIVSAEWLGRTVPLHATSTGKALLAALGPRGLRQLLPAVLEAHTATTITDHGALVAELAATRTRGYAVCHGELESHLHGVSAPVLDSSGQVLAVVSIWGPDVRVTTDRLPELGLLAAEAAAEIAAALG